MSKCARHRPGFYELLLIDACDSGYKSKYRPIVKPTVMGVFEVEHVVAKRIQGRETAYFVQWKPLFSRTEQVGTGRSLSGTGS